MHVLVPIDDSDPARAAVEHAVTTYPDAEVTVVHAIEPSFGSFTGTVTYDFDRVVEAEQERAEELFDAARAIGDDHGTPIATETLLGAPGRAIVAFADEADVDHVVLGSRGRTGPSRVLLGSVAEYVARRAPVPVTVVR